MGADVSAQEQFGPYLVYERLGVGGMATVHRALERGLDGFERIVALKRLLPHLAADASFIKSFVREAKLASLLNHPSIVQIFECGRVGAQYFISMEYIGGRDIRQILRHARRVSGPPPIHVTVALLLQLCDALDYAHHKTDEAGHPLGLVHRDVSPSNLLVTGAGQVKVIDFGIAKAQSAQLRTQTGRVKGKLAYMAPEALSGKELDARSDLFAAGVVCHELLTARPLFAAKNDYQTLMKIQRGDVMPPSTFNQGCPPELDAIVLRALARDPDDRFLDASDLRDALHEMQLQYNLPATERSIAEWLTWAFSLEPAPAADLDGKTQIDAPPLRHRTPRPRRSDEDDAVEIAWGGLEDPNGEPVVLDDVPDVTHKHLEQHHPTASALGADARLDLDDLVDDIPTPVPSHGGRVVTEAQRRAVAASLLIRPAARLHHPTPAQPPRGALAPHAAPIAPAPAARSAPHAAPASSMAQAAQAARAGGSMDDGITTPDLGVGVRRGAPSAMSPAMPASPATSTAPRTSALAGPLRPVAAASTPPDTQPSLAPPPPVAGAAATMPGMPPAVAAVASPIAPPATSPAGSPAGRPAGSTPPRAASAAPTPPRGTPTGAAIPRTPLGTQPPRPGSPGAPAGAMAASTRPGMGLVPVPAPPVAGAGVTGGRTSPRLETATVVSASPFVLPETPTPDPDDDGPDALQPFHAEEPGLAADTIPAIPAQRRRDPRMQFREPTTSPLLPSRPAPDDLSATHVDGRDAPTGSAAQWRRGSVDGPSLRELAGHAEPRLVTPATALFAEPEPDGEPDTEVPDPDAPAAAPAPPSPRPVVVATRNRNRGAPTSVIRVVPNKLPPLPRRRVTPWRVVTVVVVLAMLGAGAVVVTRYLPRDQTARLAPAPAPAPPAGPAVGVVQFRVTPPDARIAIDGKPVHAGTPWDVQLAPGVYQIEIQRDGHMTWLTSIHLAAGKTVPVNATLDPQPSAVVADATLVVSANPPELEVVLDGTAIAARSPVRRSLQPGPHLLVLRRDGVEVWRTAIDARAGVVYEFAPHIAEPVAAAATGAGATGTGATGNDHGAAPPPSAPPGPDPTAPATAPPGATTTTPPAPDRAADPAPTDPGAPGASPSPPPPAVASPPGSPPS